MAKTIKELANKYCEGSSFEDAVIEKPAFINGANAVLDAIQSCIDRHEDGCLALEAIILTIDELKDKENNYGNN